MISARRFRASFVRPARSFIGVLAVFLLTIGLTACHSSGNEPAAENAPPVVKVMAQDYTFEAPDTIRSGWTTFQMKNRGEEHHLFLLEKLPGGTRYADFQDEVAATFDSLRSLLRADSIDAATYRKALGGSLPGWYLNRIQPMGGVSLTAPERTATTTVNLEPGTYVMICYVRTPERRFHFLRGMLRPLIVTTDSTGASPPEADLTVTLSGLQIESDSTLSPGPHTIAVRFGDKRTGGPYGRWFQHLHLARLAGETSPQDLTRWMKPNPLMPAPIEFLGGVQDMPTGRTAYMQVDLTPGRYAWVLLNPPEQGSVKPFTVE